MVDRLTAAERTAALAELPGWQPAGSRDAIEKTFAFKSFGEAWDFMSQVALAAEAMDHHPEWSNLYNRVGILLSTHSCGGLSPLDIALARKIEAFAAKLQG